MNKQTANTLENFAKENEVKFVAIYHALKNAKSDIMKKYDVEHDDLIAFDKMKSSDVARYQELYDALNNLDEIGKKLNHPYHY